MTRRGQCRCGTILHFQLTSQGYKTRCPQCGAVVRLRAGEPAKRGRKPRKAPSAVLASPSGPPPLPTEDTDFSAEALPPSLTLDDMPADPLELGILGKHKTTAPDAQAELEVYREPEARSLGLHWWALGAVAFLVIAAVSTAVLWLG